MKKTAELLPELEYLTEPSFDVDGVQATSGIRADGKEDCDPVPVAPPVGYNAPPDLMTMIRTMIQSEALRHELAKQDFETFDEADDFEIEGDPIDALTEYERVFEPPPSPPAAVAEVPLKSAAQPPVSPSAPAPEVLDTSVLGDTNLATKKGPPAPQKVD